MKCKRKVIRKNKKTNDNIKWMKIRKTKHKKAKKKSSKGEEKKERKSTLNKRNEIKF